MPKKKKFTPDTDTGLLLRVIADQARGIARKMVNKFADGAKESKAHPMAGPTAAVVCAEAGYVALMRENPETAHLIAACAEGELSRVIASIRAVQAEVQPKPEPAEEPRIIIATQMP